MLWPLAQPALVQNGLQPVWLFSRALLSRSPRAAVVLAAAAASNDGGAAPYKKEHLVWEDGFGSRFAGSLLVCCVLAVGASRSPEAWLPAAHGAQAALRRQLLRLCHRLEWWSALGLLSSSCCALQLLLNSLSFGCAGFNTVLGPLRPQLLALTTTLQLGMWHALLGSGGMGAGAPRWPAALAASGVAATLALLPEGLHAWVNRGDTAAAAPSYSNPSPSVLDVRVGGMGCTACTAKVKGALEAMPEVLSATVSLQTESASLRLVNTARSSAAVDDSDFRRRVASTLIDAGFEPSSVDTPTSP